MTQQTAVYAADDTSFDWGAAARGVTDTFTGLLGQYLQYRTAEKQAEATGLSQAAVSNAVEKPYQVGAVPNQSGPQQPGAATGFQFTQQHLMIGGGILLAVLLIKAVK